MGEPGAFFCEGQIRDQAAGGRRSEPLAGADQIEEPKAADGQLGKLINQYMILQRIGEGGWGVVYVAEQ